MDTRAPTRPVVRTETRLAGLNEAAEYLPSTRLSEKLLEIVQEAYPDVDLGNVEERLTIKRRNLESRGQVAS